MINTYQLIPEEDKGIGWIKRTAFEIIQEAQTAFVKDLENLKSYGMSITVILMLKYMIILQR